MNEHCPVPSAQTGSSTGSNPDIRRQRASATTGREVIMSQVSETSVPTIAVTGTTGRLGGLVARRQSERDVTQKLQAPNTALAPRRPCYV